MNRIALLGCRPEPLASYLKSLAVLRLVAEQRDPDARGCWRDDVFQLESELTAEELVHFFVEEYRPTPIVAPWNGGSGFYEGDQMEGIDGILRSTEVRLGPYRAAIAEIRQWPELPPWDQPLGVLIDAVRAEAQQHQGKARTELVDLLTQVEEQLPIIDELVAPTKALDCTISRLTELKMAHRDLAVAVRSANKLRTAAKKILRSVGKAALVLAARERLSDRAVEWVDAAIAMSGDGALHSPPPPLLASGGNEGRIEYSNVFMRCINRLLVESADGESSARLLEQAVLARPTSELVEVPAGQFEPGRAGGYNQGPGIENKEFPINPWTFVLAMEGTIAWSSTITRRNSAGGASSPFTVRARNVGFVSAADDSNARAEIWAPIWRRPVGYPELQAFLGEGRAETGRRQASNGIEFAIAASSLGVDRGVSQFARYGLVERRGKGYYIALPEGRFSVQDRSEADLVRQLDPLLRRLDTFLRRFPNSEPPPRLGSARRAIDEEILHGLARGGPRSVSSLLAALGRIERLIAERDRSKDPKLSRPLTGLQADWIFGAADGSAEVRIAAALASIGSTGKVGPLRANLSPVDPSWTSRWADRGRQVAWSGNSLAERLSGALARRMLDAERLDCPSNPVGAGLSLTLGDVAAFLEGGLDERVLEDLLFGFTLVDWRDRAAVRAAHERWGDARALTGESPIPTSYCLLKLLFLPKPLRIGDAKIQLRPEPAIVPLLLANRVRDACRIARRRLFAAGLSPLAAELPDGDDGTRLAAALLLPVRSPRSLARRALLESETLT